MDIGQVHGWIDRQNGYIDRYTEGQMENIEMNGWIDKWMDDEWVDR